MPSKSKPGPTIPPSNPLQPTHPPPLPANWPTTITYLSDQTYSAHVTPEQHAALGRTAATSATYPRIPPSALTIPYPHISIRPITDPSHPAFLQLGLFASVPLPPDSFICLYLGHVHTNALSDSDPHSDYDLSLDRDIGLSIDAARAGNESRCINDYRGVPGAGGAPNAEFRDVLVRVECGKRKGGWKWERRVAVFVLSAGKAGRRKKGIGVGGEVLVSYGKGFWDGRKGVGEGGGAEAEETGVIREAGAGEEQGADGVREV